MNTHKYVLCRFFLSFFLFCLFRRMPGFLHLQKIIEVMCSGPCREELRVVWWVNKHLTLKGKTAADFLFPTDSQIRFFLRLTMQS